MNVLDMAQEKVALRKVSTTHGGEWQGPCPGCGGKDRFHVWPDQNGGSGAYWCRVCELGGDAIQFLRDFEGLSFRDACARLEIDLPSWSTGPHSAGSQRHAAPEFTPAAHTPPAAAWQEKAQRFVAWAEARLGDNTEAIAWLAARGISASTARAYRLGWNPGEDGRDIYRARKAWGLPEDLKEDGRPKALWIPRGLVIPCFTGLIDGVVDSSVVHRIRIRRPENEPRYYVLPGSSMTTMICEPARRAFVIVESELDAIACSAATKLAGAVALGSVAAKPDVTADAILSGALQILNALDYDAAGAKAYAWWSRQYPRCDRWPTPAGKDPGEAVRMGTALKEWIEAGLPPALTLAQDSGKETGPGGARSVVVAEAPDELPPTILELRELLKRNPGVRIINTPNRYAVLRNGKYVGGRINELVFRDPDVIAYVQHHPAAEIHGGNLIE